MVKRIIITAITVLALMALTVPATYAIPTLRLSDGTTTVTIGDGSLLDTGLGAGIEGLITYSGTIGVWKMNVTTGLSKPESGSTLFPNMDINSFNASSIAGGFMEIMFSDDYFGPVQGNFIAEIGGTTVGTLTYGTFLDGGNGLFVLTTPLTGIDTYGPGAFSGTASSGIVDEDSSYSLTQKVTINHLGKGTTSFDGTLAVPEPSTLLLLGAGLLGMVFLRRKVKN